MGDIFRKIVQAEEGGHIHLFLSIKCKIANTIYLNPFFAKEGEKVGRTIKIDITNKVVAKFRPDYLELYTSKFMIGKFYVYTEGKEYVLEDGYIYEDGKFYRIIDTHRGNNQAAEGCDLGWC